jgi:hypothetical protein
MVPPMMVLFWSDVHAVTAASPGREDLAMLRHAQPGGRRRQAAAAAYGVISVV